MDGFAVKASDVIAGAKLKVIETIAAGSEGQKTIATGEAAAIMTGAPLPTGADAVVPVEWTTRQGDCITINRAVKPGNAIACRGSDTSANRLLLAKGTKLNAAQIAVAAFVGKSYVLAHPAPLVSLITTGDESIPIDQKPTGSQIRNSNGPMMIALLKQLGCIVRDLGSVRDDQNTIRNAIEKGLESDALFITGGMSMGEKDYVPSLLRELGLQLRISKVRIKPGKPFVFAVGDAGNRPNPPMVFGLPGNPVSALVCTLVMASRILQRLAGGEVSLPLNYLKTLADLIPNGPRELYLPARMEPEGVMPLTSTGSADIFTLAQGNCLIRQSENSPMIRAGTMVAVLPIT